MSEQRRLSSFASGAHTFFKCFICQRLIWHRNETSYYPQFFFRFICSLSLAFSFLSHFQFNVIVGQFVVVAWESRERQTENEGTSKRNEKRVVAVISSQLTFQEDEQNEKIDFDSFDLELNVTAFSDEIFFLIVFSTDKQAQLTASDRWTFDIIFGIPAKSSLFICIAIIMIGWITQNKNHKKSILFILFSTRFCSLVSTQFLFLLVAVCSLSHR